MSFLKSLGKGVGDVSGTILGGGIKAIGEITDSEFISEVGNGVQKSMQYTGQVLGHVADGVADVGIGVLSDDPNIRNQGFENLGETVVDVGSQIGNSVVSVAKQGGEAVEAVIQGDYDKAKDAGVGLAKVVAVSTLAVGLVDVVDGIDVSAMDLGDLSAENTGYDLQVENENSHYVNPYERELASGEKIWVDGDGDTSVDRATGWVQSNPDYTVKVG